MSSTSAQPQFRYTQPPSKVIHVRNLPWECTEEELTELGKPFGKIVNTKCNVGANQNQAFVEFAELNQAIAMVSYYASSADPAQVRGKTVYLQYSNRQEIMNSKSSGDVISNVLLVTIEGVEAGDVSIDVLHLVFSAFGFVHKIATFEKTAGFQALVQFSDSVTASTAKDALDGRSIPRYLLQEHIGPCSLKINFSAHTDLNVKFQSHRSRDYTNPYLPVAPSAIDGSGQLGIGQDGTKQEPESNVLLASIENMQYSVSIDVLHTVFSNFGFVQKIAIFEKNAGFQALVQFPDIPTAVVAKETLEGHPIYDGGFCKLHLTYSRHTDLNVKINNDRGRDYTGANTVHLNNQPSILGQPVPQPSTAVQYPQAGNGVLPPPSQPSTAVQYPQAGNGVLPPPSQPSTAVQYPQAGNGVLPPPSSWNAGASSQGIMSAWPPASWGMGVAPRGLMPTRPAGNCDGAGLIAAPLHNQGFMSHPPMPQVMGPEMKSHPGQAWPQLPWPPSMPYGR